MTIKFWIRKIIFFCRSEYDFKEKPGIYVNGKVISFSILNRQVFHSLVFTDIEDYIHYSLFQ